MSVHTITAEIEVQFRIPDMPEDEHETAYPKVEIEYEFTKGYPATGPSYASGGEPGAAAEVSLISAKLIDGDGLDPEPSRLKEWAEDWLDNEGYDQAVDNATTDRRPDPDDERDRRHDDELTRSR